MKKKSLHSWTVTTNIFEEIVVSAHECTVWVDSGILTFKTDGRITHAFNGNSWINLKDSGSQGGVLP